MADIEIVNVIMAGPDVSSKNPQPLTDGVHEVRELENEALQTNSLHEVREVENKALQTNGLHEVREVDNAALQTNGVQEVREVENEAFQINEVPVEAIQTNGIHTDPSPEISQINSFQNSPSSEPETNGSYTSPTIQKNGIHPEFIKANGVHKPSDVDDITAVSQEAPVVNGIHPLKAAKLEAATAVAHAASNGVQLESEHVAKMTINKTRSDSGVVMTDETTAH